MSIDDFRHEHDEWELERAADRFDREHDMDALLGQDRPDPDEFTDVMAEAARARHRTIGTPS